MPSKHGQRCHWKHFPLSLKTDRPWHTPTAEIFIYTSKYYDWYICSHRRSSTHQLVRWCSWLSRILNMPLRFFRIRSWVQSSVGSLFALHHSGWLQKYFLLFLAKLSLEVFLPYCYHFCLRQVIRFPWFLFCSWGFHCKATTQTGVQADMNLGRSPHQTRFQSRRFGGDRTSQTLEMAFFWTKLGYRRALLRCVSRRVG